MANWLQLLKNYLGYQGATSLADKLTAARAGYLDNINQAGLLQITAARAANLDLIPDPAINKVWHPFGKGSLTTDGVQYSAEVAGITHLVWGVIQTITITQPVGYTLEEIELGLTGAIKSSGATKHVKWKWQASDNGAAWQDLIAAQTRAADASVYADRTAAGRFAPTGNFLGTGGTFQVQMVIQAEDATETVAGKAKNSSYVLCIYRRT